MIIFDFFSDTVILMIGKVSIRCFFTIDYLEAITISLTYVLQHILRVNSSLQQIDNGLAWFVLILTKIFVISGHNVANSTRRQIKHCRFVFFTIISTSIKTILSERDTLMREALFVFLEIDNGISTNQIATLPSIGLKYRSLPMHSPW